MKTLQKKLDKEERKAAWKNERLGARAARSGRLVEEEGSRIEDGRIGSEEQAGGVGGFKRTIKSGGGGRSKAEKTARVGDKHRNNTGEDNDSNVFRDKMEGYIP